ncbi:MAG: DNA polymerase III subunit epsilon [Thiotrichales bacterium]
MRQIVLDTETTGLDPKAGHRVIEIGCVEMVNRRLTGKVFHQYLQPDREVEQGAVEVHGITNEFLADKPRMEDVIEQFVDFIRGAELIIHNAPFDVGFLNHEFALVGPGWGQIDDIATVIDTLVMAREMHKGQRNSLDALCKRYDVDNSSREYHGALLDSRILAEVYLAMTGGQTALLLQEEDDEADGGAQSSVAVPVTRSAPLRIIAASPEELDAHEQFLATLRKSSDREVAW